MKIDSNLLKLLMEIGFLATNNGRPKEATVIFQGIAKARPKSAYPQIGLGCVAMAYGKFPQALEILRAAPTADRTERELCTSFYGMALKLGGYDDECRSILTQLQAEGENEVAVKMAGSLLEELVSSQ